MQPRVFHIEFHEHNVHPLIRRFHTPSSGTAELMTGEIQQAREH